MKIQTQDLYHGAVLTQITEHSSFKALNKVDSQYGHYLVNHDTRLFVKYLTKQTSPWSFKFSISELRAIQHDIESSSRVFLCLVCGHETICTLDIQEFSNLIDLSSIENQYIFVDVPASGSMHVRGSGGKLDRTLRHNSFPAKLFIEASEAAGV
ncbi:hypothetical protein ACQCVK_13505 [Rossellomorea vietnamensis]|uniref:hypothetical protein n=1 Tax=Rossellomorea vietnamensis TaxID=218284 RepID=UPI003CF8D12B